MEYTMKGMFGEKSLTKVVGVFPDKAQADAAASQVLKAPGMLLDQARVLGPQDARMSRREIFSRTLEPEQRGIYKSIFITHGVTGLVGAVVGLLLYVWLLRSGHPAVASSPLLAFIPIVGFATTFGLLLGGLMTIRPDHVWLITKVRGALKHNRWAVVVHPLDPDQREAAKAALGASGGQVLSTL